MDDFLIVLAVALVLIVVAGLYFSYVPSTTVSETLSLTEFQVGEIGLSSSIPSREVRIDPFTAGELQEDTLLNLPELKISRNLFSGNDEIREVAVDTDVLEKITISFSVKEDESNDYGDLVLEWNGQEIYRGKEIGIQSIDISKENVTEKNNINIKSSGPGFIFWASSEYVLEGLKVKQELSDVKRVAFSLDISEIETLDKGEITFNAAGSNGAGNLIMKLNGDAVYNQKPANPAQILIDDPTRFLRGNNIITFSSQPGQYAVSNFVLKIFSLSKSVSKQKNFDIDKARLDKLKGESIEMDIEVIKVNNAGHLKIDINNNRLPFVVITSTGTQTLAFSKSYLKESDNTISFETNGDIEIGKIRIYQ